MKDYFRFLKQKPPFAGCYRTLRAGENVESVFRGREVVALDVERGALLPFTVRLRRDYGGRARKVTNKGKLAHETHEITRKIRRRIVGRLCETAFDDMASRRDALQSVFVSFRVFRGPNSGLPLRRDQKIAKKLADLFPHFLAMNDHVDQTVFL